MIMIHMGGPDLALEVAHVYAALKRYMLPGWCLRGGCVCEKSRTSITLHEAQSERAIYKHIKVHLSSLRDIGGNFNTMAQVAEERTAFVSFDGRCIAILCTIKMGDCHDSSRRLMSAFCQ